jgi:hypothetical protein
MIPKMVVRNSDVDLLLQLLRKYNNSGGGVDPLLLPITNIHDLYYSKLFSMRISDHIFSSQ